MKILQKKITETGRVHILFCNMKILSFRSKKNHTIFPESKLANKYLKGLYGIEIGGSSHNDFKLNTLNIDYTDCETQYSKSSWNDFGIKPMKVDIVASGDNLPFDDNTWDFVINSHVIEHFFDPVKTIQEWIRVIKPGGYLFMIVPHKERTNDKTKKRTTLKELIDRHSGLIKDPHIDGHYSVWITQDFLELCRYMKLNVIEYQDIDDKAGNGFAIVIQK